MEIIEGDCLADNLDLWGELVHKKVTVTTDNGNSYVGIIKTIDPISRSIVLVEYNDDEPPKAQTVKIITGHAVKELTIQADQPKQINFDITKEQVLSDNELKERKNKLMTWFQKNRIPVVEGQNEELIVASVIKIKPPYGKDDCSSGNVIVVRRIQDLMSKMPNGLVD